MPDINEPTESTLDVCPFCGGKAHLVGDRLRGYWVECRIYCFGPHASKYGVKAEAIAAWNRRVSSAPSVADVRVKPLEWERYWAGGDESIRAWRPTNAIGGYWHIHMDGDSWTDGTCETGRFGSLAEAKAARQVAYEQRVRSVLDIVSAPSFADGIEAAAKYAAKLRDDSRLEPMEFSEIAKGIRALAHNPQASSGGDEGKWLGPYKTAAEALDDCRKAVATEIGADPETWPDHGNAALAIAATVALARIRNRSGAAEGNEAEAPAPKPDPGRFVAEPAVPDHVIREFERKYGGSFDLSRDDHEWRNTWRYKHDHIQSLWAGWRDGYLALSDTSSHEAPKPDPAIAELVERAWQTLVEMDDRTSPEEYPEHALITKSELAEFMGSTASNDRVAELERERDEALATMTRATEAMVECGNLLADEELKREAAEAEVSRLKAGAVTDWQLIESVPKDGRSIAVWLPATATEQPHAFAPVSICEDGTWWDDSTGDQIEPLAATYWAPIHAPSALSNQARASK